MTPPFDYHNYGYSEGQRAYLWQKKLTEGTYLNLWQYPPIYGRACGWEAASQIQDTPHGTINLTFLDVGPDFKNLPAIEARVLKIVKDLAQ